MDDTADMIEKFQELTRHADSKAAALALAAVAAQHVRRAGGDTPKDDFSELCGQAWGFSKGIAPL